MGAAAYRQPSETLVRLRSALACEGPAVHLSGTLLPCRCTDTASVVRLPDGVEVRVVRPPGGYSSLLWDGPLDPAHLHGCSVARWQGQARYVHVFYRESVVVAGQFGQEQRVRDDELLEQSLLLERLVRRLRVLMGESYRHESEPADGKYAVETLARVGHVRSEPDRAGGALVTFRGGQRERLGDAEDVDWNDG